MKEALKVTKSRQRRLRYAALSDLLPRELSLLILNEFWCVLSGVVSRDGMVQMAGSPPLLNLFHSGDSHTEELIVCSSLRVVASYLPPAPYPPPPVCVGPFQ